MLGMTVIRHLSSGRRNLDDHEAAPRIVAHRGTQRRPRPPFQLIGHSAGGVALFLTGLILSSQRVELSLNVSGRMLVKSIVHPLLAVGLILVLPIDRSTARAAVLLCALPSGFFGVLLGLRYGLESHVAGATLIASSIASILTLPAVLVLTGG